MSLKKWSSTDSFLPCTWKPASDCAGCELKANLMCRYDARDLTSFMVNFLPFGITAVAGMVIGGYGWYLLLWFAYWIIFFFVWEASILCRHCPYWAEESRVLHCHANYGVFKIWKSKPGPMSRSEQIQFVAGVALFVSFPLFFLILGEQYLLAVIALAVAVSAGYNLRRNVCSRCINFSCPVNAVPKPLVDAYLRRNPEMRGEWEASGYQLGDYGI